MGHIEKNRMQLERKKKAEFRRVPQGLQVSGQQIVVLDDFNISYRE